MANILMIAPLNAANFDSGNAEAGKVLTADGSGGAEWAAAGGGTAEARYRYIAILNQEGENAPVATVFENTLPPCPEIVWQRLNPGYYKTENWIIPWGADRNRNIVLVGSTFTGNTPHHVSAFIEADGVLHLVVTSFSEGQEDNALTNFPLFVEHFPTP